MAKPKIPGNSIVPLCGKCQKPWESEILGNRSFPKVVRQNNGSFFCVECDKLPKDKDFLPTFTKIGEINLSTLSDNPLFLQMQNQMAAIQAQLTTMQNFIASVNAVAPVAVAPVAVAPVAVAPVAVAPVAVAPVAVAPVAVAPVAVAPDSKIGTMEKSQYEQVQKYLAIFGLKPMPIQS